MPLTCAIFQRNQTNRSFLSQGFLVRQNLPCNSNEPMERIGAVRKNKRFVGAIGARSIACARLLVSAVSEKSGRAVIKRVSEKRREEKREASPRFSRNFSRCAFSNILEPGTEATRSRSTHKKRISPDIPLLNDSVWTIQNDEKVWMRTFAALSKKN